MTHKPTVLPPEWCTTNAPYDAPTKPWDGQTRKIDPGSSVQNGYAPGTKPPVTEYNYQLNAIGQWLVAYAESLVTNWFQLYESTESYEITALGHYPPTNEFLFGTIANRSLYTNIGYTFLDVQDVSFGVGGANPVTLMENTDTDLLLVTDSPGGNAAVLRYVAGATSLQYTFANDVFFFSSFKYDASSGLWILVGDELSTKATIWTSGDLGASWTQRTTSASTNYIDGLASVAGNPSGLLVAIEGQSTGTDSFVSLDGINWTLYDDLGFLNGAKVHYDETTGYFIIASEATTPETHISSNGTSWTKVTNWATFGTSWKVINAQSVGGLWVIIANLLFPSIRTYAFVSSDQGQSWETIGMLPGTEVATLFKAQAFKRLGNVLVVGIGNDAPGSPKIRITRNLA